jgi:hypothetical protein
VIELIGTVEVRPCLSHVTVAVPAFGSTDLTRPISPVAFLRTWPGGNSVKRVSAFGGLFGAGRGDPGAGGFRAGEAGAAFGCGFSSTSSSGTMRAPVPFVSVSSTHLFAMSLTLDAVGQPA